MHPCKSAPKKPYCQQFTQSQMRQYQTNSQQIPRRTSTFTQANSQSSLNREFNNVHQQEQNYSLCSVL